MLKKKLLIVESPNKIKKIQSFLDSSWVVSASVGHIRDLPPKEMGIDLKTFEINYTSDSKKKSIISKLKNLSRECNEVYLATDDDREGEAIAFHLKVVLGLKDYKRIKFNEITKDSVISAIKNAGKIDMNLVHAQEARRALDRLVGYTISPIISNMASIPLSAGRVQSPCLKIVTLREQEIKNFISRNTYSIDLVHRYFKASLDKKSFVQEGEKNIFDETLIDEILTSVKTIKIEHIESLDKKVPPKPPFTTSTLQQTAHSNFKMTANDTMKAAQALFELGAISYHRTDSQNLSTETFDKFCIFWNEKGISTQKEKIKFQTKGGAQEAHEAIRPTYPENENEGSNDNEKKIYALIRERALNSVLDVGIDKTTTLILTANLCETVNSVSQAKFSTTAKEISYLGWRKQAIIETTKQKDTLIDTSTLNVGEALKNYSLEKTESKTIPPKRFTEGTLIKALERLEIGRPSTYASILENIKNRKYIKTLKGEILPTPLGMSLVESLKNQSFMNLEFTKILEGYLDKISMGKMQYIEIVGQVYSVIEIEKNEIHIANQEKITPCPLCGKPLKKIVKPNNTFWVHMDNSKNDDDCLNYINDENGKPTTPKDK